MAFLYKIRFGAKRAFSLLEMLLAIVLLAIGVVGLMRAFGLGIFAGGDAENHILSLSLAQEKIEEIIEDKKTQGFSYIVNANYPYEAQVSGFTNFSRQVNVANLAADLKQVTVSVSRTVRGASISTDLDTLVADY